MVRIVGARIAERRRIADSNGDTWSATWADDDRLYVASDDCRGFGRACDSNLAINVVTGASVQDLAGETINPMSAYGTLGEQGPDGATWKANGLTCIDGTLYLAVSRHRYGVAPYFVQQTWDASIVASSDHGRAWSPMPRLGGAMFPGRAFSTPFFVQYGRDGRAEVDGADEYVYAASSDGGWNNVSTMTLGRAPRDRLPALDGADWEFVAGFDDERRPLWTSHLERALFVLRAPGQIGMSTVQYIAPLGLYLMPQWHYVYPADTAGYDWVSFVTTRPTQLDLYVAPAPWGPWGVVHRQRFAEGWYNPSVPAKLMSDDGRRLPIFVSSCGGHDFEHYTFVVLEIELDIAG